MFLKDKKELTVLLKAIKVGEKLFSLLREIPYGKIVLFRFISITMKIIISTIFNSVKQYYETPLLF